MVSARNAREIAAVVNWALLPMHSWDEGSDLAVNGMKGAFRLKCEAIRLLAKEGTHVAADTVATRENIRNLDKIAALAKGLPIKEWFIAVPVPCAEARAPVSSADVEELCRKIIELRKKGFNTYLAQAVPFCACDPALMRTVASGALAEGPHTALVVDPEGTIKPHYSITVQLGKIGETTIREAWDHEFARGTRHLKRLPKECKACRFKAACRGGSRFSAWLSSGKWEALDPLARPAEWAESLYC